MRAQLALRRTLILRGQRETEPEGAAVPWRALDADRPAMTFDDGAGDVETQSQVYPTPGGFDVLGPMPEVPDQRLLLCGNTLTEVLYLDARVRRLA